MLPGATNSLDRWMGFSLPDYRIVMKRDERQELLSSFQLLTDAAERFLFHAPQSKRLEEEQRVLLAAITQAQLVLSVHGLPPPEAESSRQKLKKSHSKFDKKSSPRRLMRLV